MISLSYLNPVLNQTKSRTKYQSLGLTLLNARSSYYYYYQSCESDVIIQTDIGHKHTQCIINIALLPRQGVVTETLSLKKHIIWVILTSLQKLNLIIEGFIWAIRNYESTIEDESRWSPKARGCAVQRKLDWGQRFYHLSVCCLT